MENIKQKLNPYLPGIIVFIIAVIIGLLTYHDYGIAWDEPLQRAPSVLSFNYIFHNDQSLFTTPNDNHGAGYEMLLLFIEKGLKLTDTRDIYTMRHIVTHILFMLSMFVGYVLMLRLYKNTFIATLGFIILAFTPRIYAHSFFNSKDIPFLFMVVLTFSFFRYAFEKNKTWPFLVLGLLCGYATSIRIMGIMLCSFIELFLLIDLVTAIMNKEKPLQPILKIVSFTTTFCAILYASWPYLWKSPVHTFIESFHALAHFKWEATTLVSGKMEQATNLPWTYFPTWFTITTPVLWLIAGAGGICRIVYEISKNPMAYLKNTPERNYLLYLLCFFVPILSVMLLHSVVFDDWRHLFFVYPPFVLMGLYFINKLLQYKYKIVVQVACGLQVLAVSYFMVINHPFHQVYFNELVSHEDEYLRKNYELDYWGVSFKQALDHILEADPRKHINICCNLIAYLETNKQLLHEEDRNRIQITPPDSADYFITNFRSHPEDYPGTTSEYTITVLNSSVLQVFMLKPPPPPGTAPGK